LALFPCAGLEDRSASHRQETILSRFRTICCCLSVGNKDERMGKSCCAGCEMTILRPAALGASGFGGLRRSEHRFVPIELAGRISLLAAPALLYAFFIIRMPLLWEILGSHPALGDELAKFRHSCAFWKVILTRQGKSRRLCLPFARGTCLRSSSAKSG
jgi:hypothetical protein